MSCVWHYFWYPRFLYDLIFVIFVSCHQLWGTEGKCCRMICDNKRNMQRFWPRVFGKVGVGQNKPVWNSTVYWRRTAGYCKGERYAVFSVVYEIYIYFMWQDCLNSKSLLRVYVREVSASLSSHSVTKILAADSWLFIQKFKTSYAHL